jgi:predicted O-methyltransferase YrrM
MNDVYLSDHLDEEANKMNESLPYFRDQYQRFLRNTRGLPVELIKKISRDAFFDIRNLRFDFVFIDGDHRKDAVLHDGHMALALTREDGTAHILFDDYLWSPGTKEAIDEILDCYKDRIEVLVKDQQVLIRKKY